MRGSGIPFYGGPSDRPAAPRTVRLFPLHPSTRRDYPDLPSGIPWEFVAPHEEQARRNHSQSLERLAERGGLAAAELMAVLTDTRWEPWYARNNSDQSAALLAIIGAALAFDDGSE